ncbi:hypothetical protein BD413DRAFT_563060 [Trametes elegans]|nr:hypothetical protein BD413DRAFT_563060 [Trametes elegans]
MALSRAPPDVIHEILIRLSDFASLAATIRASKSVYDVFQGHPRLITHTVLSNAVGAGLPQAARLAFYAVHRVAMDDPRVDDLPSEEAFQGIEWSWNRNMITVMETRSKAAQTLVDLYSLRHKDRTSPCSALDEHEAVRFRRALYRYWLLYDISVHEGFLRQQDDGSDDEEEDDDGLDLLSYNASGITAMLQPLTNEELFEMQEVATFCLETESWNTRAVESLYPIHLTAMRMSPVDPMMLTQILQELWRSTGPLTSTRYIYIGEDPALAAAREILRDRKVSEERLTDPNVHAKAVVHTIRGEHDTCSRCHTVCGINLLGTTNMQLLAGLVTIREKVKLLPGLLSVNHDEVGQLVGHLRDHLQPVADEHLVRELMDMEPEGEDADNEHWSNNDWYCLECVKHLFRQRLMLWWRETKRQKGMQNQEDCWYGYNCRTMTHRPQHAARLNHLCKPTRGEAPNFPSGSNTT